MKTTSKILIVEDETDIAELMCLHLKREGLEVEQVESGEEALKRIQTTNYQLLVLDWMLPGISGLELCKKLRQEKLLNRLTPILMITARAQTSDIVLGLEVGADDYLTKPFELPEMLARVRALLRRSSQLGEPDTNRIQIGQLLLDAEKHEVKCAKGEVSLTPSEFKLLHALMKNSGRVLTRERLIELVQGEGVSVVDRAIDTHVFGLRKKLGTCGDLVETIRGVGYRVNYE